jgi:hypothetical protein
MTALVQQFRNQAARGQITWAAAVRRARETRNDVREAMRGRSTPVGRAVAEALKGRGRTLSKLIGCNTVEKLGTDAVFERPTPTQKNAVYAEIVEAAGRANPRVNALLRRWSRAGPDRAVARHFRL